MKLMLKKAHSFLHQHIVYVLCMIVLLWGLIYVFNSPAAAEWEKLAFAITVLFASIFVHWNLLIKPLLDQRDSYQEYCEEMGTFNHD